VVLLNLPPEMCYRANNVIIPLAIPGPCAPGNVESFIYPLFEEMAMASVECGHGMPLIHHTLF